MTEIGLAILGDYLRLVSPFSCGEAWMGRTWGVGTPGGCGVKEPVNRHAQRQVRKLSLMGRELYGEMKEEEEGGHAGFGVGPNSHAVRS